MPAALFWGLQQILIKTTVTEVPPLWQAAIRMSGAVVLLWLWCRRRGVPLFERDGTLPGGLLAGALFAGEFICIYLGLQHTTASRLTVFLYTSPFVVALLLPRFVAAERLRGVQWLGLVHRLRRRGGGVQRELRREQQPRASCAATRSRWRPACCGA